MDITEYLTSRGVEIADSNHRHGRRGWVQVDCPDCGPGSHKFHCGIHLASLRCSCWRCGKKDIWAVLRAVANATTAELVLLTKGRVQGLSEAREPTGGVYKPPPGLEPLAPAHRAYLANRGLDPDYCAEVWGAQGLSIAGPMSWRVFIPVIYHRRPVSWTTRHIGTATQRYISADKTQEAVHHKDILYGSDLAHHAAIIVEGPLDTWRIGPGCVCTFGQGYSMAQLTAMAAYPVRAICFDMEPEAQDRARRLVHDLTPFPGVTHLVELETAKDPGAAQEWELEEIRQAFLR